MAIGYYDNSGQKYVSVTSWIDYTFGIADEIDRWSTKQAILAVIRKSKLDGKILTQEQATEIGLQARLDLLKKAQDTGLEIHQAIQNYHSGIPYDLEDAHKPYFESYFNWANDHNFETIKQEEKVYNDRFGYAGRFDWYGKLDGKYWLLDFKTSKSCRWSYGLQLACYRKCLEEQGYTVDGTAVVHIKPRRRGSNPYAEFVEYDTPFELVESGLKLFKYKVNQDLYVKWAERSDLEAVTKEMEQIKKDPETAMDFTPISVPNTEVPPYIYSGESETHENPNS